MLSSLGKARTAGRLPRGGEISRKRPFALLELAKYPARGGSRNLDAVNEDGLAEEPVQGVDRVLGACPFDDLGLELLVQIQDGLGPGEIVLGLLADSPQRSMASASPGVTT